MGTAAPVLICGAGPVGLGAALELARFGVRSVLLERRATTSWHPKTRNLNTRTMEIAAGWGADVYRRLRAIDTPPGWKSPIRFLDTAIGEEFGQIESLGFVGPGPELSPAEPVMSSQDLVEAILLDAVRATGLVDVRFSTEVLRVVRGMGPDHHGAAVEVRDLTRNTLETISGSAIVAADGADSMVREQLGVALHGLRDLSHLVNCYFQSDIESLLGDRTGVLFFVSNQGARGVLQPLDARGRWLCQINVSAADWSAEAFTHERALQWVRTAVGVDDLDVTVRSLGFWKLNATTAERFVQGRVVLCGDAAHQFPPTGGLGVNTGLQGMHNAMWKLALWVNGEADWSLVESYHDERHPVASRIVAQSLENSANVGRIAAAAMTRDDTGLSRSSGLSTEDAVAATRRYGNHLGVELGANYRSNAVIDDGTSVPGVADDYSDYVPSGTPGARAPHLTLGRGSGGPSTLDLFGPSFTLLSASASHVDATRLLTASGRIRLRAYQIGAPGLEDPTGRFAALYGVDPDGAVLVRPDGHVAWRVHSWSDRGEGGSFADALTAALVRVSRRPAT